MPTPEIQAFLTIAREGHLTRAARRLHLTQPAVSAQLKRLEEEVGAQLFHRTPKGMVLTEAGSLFRRYAEEARTWLDDGKAALAGLANLEQGSLAIGAGATATTYLLPPLIRRYHDAHPGIRLTVREQGSAAVADGVRSGELDLGIVTLPVSDDRGLELTPWRADELLLIVPPAHPLAGRSAFGWSDLDGQPLILFEADSAVRRLIDEALEQHAVQADPVMELRSIETIKQLVAQGIGAAFVSRYALMPGAGLRPRTGHPPRRDLAICRRADRAPSAATAAFLGALSSL